MAKDNERKIITGIAGFEFTVRGTYPPSIEAMPENQRGAWVAAQVSMNANFLQFLRDTEVREVRFGLDGAALPTGPLRANGQ